VVVWRGLVLDRDSDSDLWLVMTGAVCLERLVLDWVLPGSIQTKLLHMSRDGVSDKA
jgi:hypothetical protein